MKTLAILKRQQFKDSKSEKTEPRGSKCRWLYARGNEEGESLDEFESEGEGEVIEYIPFPFVTPPQKESNDLTDMGKGIKSLNHLI